MHIKPHDQSLFQDELFRFMVENVKDYAVFSMDVEGRVTGWNDGAASLFGYTEEEIKGRNASILLSPEEINRGVPEQELQTVAKIGKAEGEHWLVRKDKTTFRANIVTVQFKDQAGKTSSYAKLVHDLTVQRQAEELLHKDHKDMERQSERPIAELIETNTLLEKQIIEHQRTEKALRESHSLLMAVTEGTTDLIYVKNLKGHYVMVNPAMSNLLGKPVQEIIGLDDTLLFPSTAKQFLESDRRVIQSGEILVYEEKIVIADVLCTYLTVKTPYRNMGGQIIGVIGISRDITVRKRSEEALRESEERFRRLIRELQVGVILHGPGTEIIMANRAALDLLGLSEDQLIGKTSFDPSWNMIREDGTNFPGHTHPVPQAIAERKPVRNVLMGVYRSKTQDRVWLLVDAVPQIAPDGDVSQVICTFSDVTGRRQSEDERLQLLRRLVTAQEEERHRIARELHDQTGQYLTALMLGLKSLQDSTQPLSLAREQLQQLLELTAEFAIEARNFAIELRPAALDDLGLHAALSNYVEEWSARHAIVTDFHSNGLIKRRLPVVVETTIYRIVQEALNNVLKHAQAQRVSIIIEYRANRVLTIIEDDGAGFDVETTMNSPAAKRGLGLLGMRERVALVGGELNIESTPGSGTTLFVRIPTPPLEQRNVSS